MIIKKLTNFIGGKIMKTKIINTGSTTDVVEILLSWWAIWELKVLTWL